MQVKVKKSVLLNLIEKINENKSSRGDTLFNNTTGFFGNFGAVKSSDESPIKPKPQMALQLSADEPPVDDPDFIPVTTQELGLAAARISKEVPSEKIEYFYRKLHKLLDAALDDDDKNLFALKEAINYDEIDNPSHKKSIENLIDQAIAMSSRNPSDKNYMTKEQAALFAYTNDLVSRYPSITYEDIIDELEKELDEPSEEEKLADEIADTISGETESSKDIIVNPPGSLTDLSPPTASKGKRRIVRGATRKIGTPEAEPKKKKKSKRKKQKDVEGPSIEALDKKAEDEMMDMLAYAYTEYTEMEEFAATWDWTNYEEDAPYLKVMFDVIKILHQLSYRILQANYINKYGGYVYDPDAETRGGKKGAFVLEKQGPTSRPEAQAMIARIQSDFGLTYTNMMRQQNILKMKHEELIEVIERAMIGIFQRLPQLYGEFRQAVQADITKRNLAGDPKDLESDAFGFIVNVLSHKYRGESEVLDRDLVNIAIAGIFKRCLLDLPGELGISPSVTMSVDAMSKKKTQKTDVTYGFNLAGATKRFEKLRKDTNIAKKIKRLMPPLILKRITETLTAKVKKISGGYNFEDKSTGLGYVVKAKDLKTKIKDYVEERLKGKQPTFDEDVPETVDVTPYDEEAEEKEAKARLSKDDYETRKIVKEMEKMIASGDWMHIAPLFGFSGAPGVRSWYLRYPERKFMIMKAARATQGPSGAKRYLEVFREMRANLANNLITMDKRKPGILDLMISEISSKPSPATSDQAMIDLLQEMKENVRDLANLYYQYDSYEELEEKKPDELKRLSNTPGGSLLRFGIGAVFDKIIKDMDTKWHEEMSDYLQIENGLKKGDADRLAYYFTGLKVKPKGEDFRGQATKISKTVEEFTKVGIEAKEFFDALRYSQGWFFSTLDKELREKGVMGQKLDNYYKMVKDLTSQQLYKVDKKSKSGFKLNKKVYNIIKKMIQGKNGAIASYLDNLAIEQFQKATQEKIKKVKTDRPDLFNL